jgi:hypothetical protein
VLRNAQSKVTLLLRLAVGVALVAFFYGAHDATKNAEGMP